VRRTVQPGGVDASTFAERRRTQNTRPALQAGNSVVVTGGAGFVGSHLCELLLQKDCHVTVLDDLRASDVANLPRRNAALHFEQLSIGTPSAAARLGQHVAHADFVFHLASPVGVSVAHFQPSATAASIVSAGAQVADACRTHERPLLFTSSSEVYGATPACPAAEDAPLALSNAPRFSYGTAKLVIEQLVAELNHQYGIPSWIVRLFNVAGPRQRPDAGVIASFVDCALSDRPLLIHGDGRQTRCFLHVSDAVEALAAVAQNRFLCGRAVNVGNNTAVTINDVAAAVAAQRPHCSTRRAAYAEVFGEHFLDVQRRIPDTRLLTETTGWRPRFTLHDIVRDCLADRAAERRRLA
jgi:UDP-glucose 4-epimerase